MLDFIFMVSYNSPCRQDIGPSPSGKATDSDSVISKVRILVGQLFGSITKVVLFCVIGKIIPIIGKVSGRERRPHVLF